MKDFINDILCKIGWHKWKKVKVHPYVNVNNRRMVKEEYECNNCSKTKTSYRIVL